jgi:hypothetical protein
MGAGGSGVATGGVESAPFRDHLGDRWTGHVGPNTGDSQRIKRYFAKCDHGEGFYALPFAGGQFARNFDMKAHDFSGSSD